MRGGSLLESRQMLWGKRFEPQTRMRAAAACRVVVGGAIMGGFAIGVVASGQASKAVVNWVAASTDTVSPQVSAFATVQSSGLATIAPSRAGTAMGLIVLPGDTVAAGQVIAYLGGPVIAADTAEAQAALTAAMAAQRTAAALLAIERQKMEQRLSTRQIIAQADSALAAAVAQTATASAHVAQMHESVVLHSPVAGIVQGVVVANGDVLTAGQAVATVQPAAGNWLKAVFYGPMPPVGTDGAFAPGSGGAPVKVSLRGVFGVAQPDGGVPVALTADGDLIPGGSGTVTLDLPARPVTLVPSGALILDKGQWWAMVHTPQGDHPVQVTPGPARGDNTVIEAGLQPGDDVVVVDAYLLYHRGIAALYQPPD